MRTDYTAVPIPTLAWGTDNTSATLTATDGTTNAVLAWTTDNWTTSSTNFPALLNQPGTVGLEAIKTNYTTSTTNLTVTHATTRRIRAG